VVAHLAAHPDRADALLEHLANLAGELADAPDVVGGLGLHARHGGAARPSRQREFRLHQKRPRVKSQSAAAVANQQRPTSARPSPGEDEAAISSSASSSTLTKKMSSIEKNSPLRCRSLCSMATVLQV